MALNTRSVTVPFDDTGLQRVKVTLDSKRGNYTMSDDATTVQKPSLNMDFTFDDMDPDVALWGTSCMRDA